MSEAGALSQEAAACERQTINRAQSLLTPVAPVDFEADRRRFEAERTRLFDQQLRDTALQRAIEANRVIGATSDGTVKIAEKFLAFLKGEKAETPSADANA